MSAAHRLRTARSDPIAVDPSVENRIDLSDCVLLVVKQQPLDTVTQETVDRGTRRSTMAAPDSIWMNGRFDV